jgi:ABC-2 type transport system ATP-binding protein
VVDGPLIRFDGASHAISARGLGRSFGARVAVEGLDLDVEPGEIFGFLGPNGAGKTTTLRMLSTLLPPSRGRASIHGLDIVERAMDVRRMLGVMTERPGLYERLSVEANLRLWAEAHEVPGVAAAIGTALERVGLSGRTKDPVSALSKGLRQRVALARAIVHRPRLLLLDEPSSGLDPSAAIQVEEMIRDLVRDGATVFLNTHRLAEAQRLCDRVAILNTRLVAVGSPADLKQRLFGASITVRLASPVTAQHEAVIRALPGVRSLRCERAALTCSLANIEQDTPAVVAALVHSGARVLEVAPAGDLEQVYLDLVHGDATEGEERAAA